jgi:hypothetical protein
MNITVCYEARWLNGKAQVAKSREPGMVELRGTVG